LSVKKERGGINSGRGEKVKEFTNELAGGCRIGGGWFDVEGRMGGER